MSTETGSEGETTLHSPASKPQRKVKIKHGNNNKKGNKTAEGRDKNKKRQTENEMRRQEEGDERARAETDANNKLWSQPP